MQDIEALKNKYFGYSGKHTQDRIQVHQGNKVTPLISGQDYFEALARELDRIGTGDSQQENKGHFIYIAAWLLNLVESEGSLQLPTESGPRPLIDILIEKARAGVDVRVLVWVSWSLGVVGRFDARYENLANIHSVQALREEKSLSRKCCLNVIGHPAGGVHSKVVVLGTQDFASGFTGGVDLDAERTAPYWIDAHVQVEGPVVQDMYDLFKDMWNQVLLFADQARQALAQPAVSFELLSQPVSKTLLPRPMQFKLNGHQVEAVLSGTPQVEDRSFARFHCGNHIVQSLRTIPQFNFSENKPLPLVSVPPIDFFPTGAFEIESALRKAILAAEQYIYIEDQYLWSQEVMRWINASLREHEELKVILVTGDFIPPGPPLPERMPVALHESLLPGLDDSQRSRIAVFIRKGFVHAKTVLVDDRWAMIGSANIARRSLYTDVEHAVSMADPEGQLVRNYRIALWKRHLNLEDGRADLLNDLDVVLSAWNPLWGEDSIKGLRLIENILRQPLDGRTIESEESDWYNMIEDPDSRQPWFFPVTGLPTDF